MLEQLTYGTGGPNDASQLCAELPFAMAAGTTIEAMRF